MQKNANHYYPSGFSVFFVSSISFALLNVQKWRFKEPKRDAKELLYGDQQKKICIGYNLKAQLSLCTPRFYVGRNKWASLRSKPKGSFCSQPMYDITTELEQT